MSDPFSSSSSSITSDLPEKFYTLQKEEELRIEIEVDQKVEITVSNKYQQI